MAPRRRRAPLPQNDGRWSRRSSARAWPSSTARWSTSRCPRIQRDLNASAFDAQWVIESYALFLASLLLAGGALGDRFGRRRVFMLGAAVFTAASVACGLSAASVQLIAARAVQGIGAALLVPGSLALISAAFPEARARPGDRHLVGVQRHHGRHRAGVGGFLVDHYSWAWAFLVNVPVGVVLLAICASKVPESRGAASQGRVDLAGALLATVGLAGVVFAFIEAPVRGWTAASVLGAAARGHRGAGAVRSRRGDARVRRCCRCSCSASATSPARTC